MARIALLSLLFHAICCCLGTIVIQITSVWDHCLQLQYWELAKGGNLCVRENDSVAPSVWSDLIISLCAGGTGGFISFVSFEAIQWLHHLPWMLRWDTMMLAQAVARLAVLWMRPGPSKNLWNKLSKTWHPRLPRAWTQWANLSWHSFKPQRPLLSTELKSPRLACRTSLMSCFLIPMNLERSREKASASKIRAFERWAEEEKKAPAMASLQAAQDLASDQRTLRCFGSPLQRQLLTQWWHRRSTNGSMRTSNLSILRFGSLELFAQPLLGPARRCSPFISARGITKRFDAWSPMAHRRRTSLHSLTHTNQHRSFAERLQADCSRELSRPCLLQELRYTPPKTTVSFCANGSLSVASSGKTLTGKRRSSSKPKRCPPLDSKLPPSRRPASSSTETGPGDKRSGFSATRQPLAAASRFVSTRPST